MQTNTEETTNKRSIAAAKRAEISSLKTLSASYLKIANYYKQIEEKTVSPSVGLFLKETVGRICTRHGVEDPLTASLALSEQKAVLSEIAGLKK